jgi:DNA replication protein DnaC
MTELSKYRKTGLPQELYGWTFEKAAESEVNDNWLNTMNHIRSQIWTNRQLPFVIIHGDNNVGKSVILSCVCSKAIDNDIIVRYINENEVVAKFRKPSFIESLEYKPPTPIKSKERYDTDKKIHIRSYENGIVLFDEFAMCDYNDEKNNVIYRKFNEYFDRITSRKTNIIFASNYPIEKIKERVGRRIWARIERRGFVDFKLTKKMVEVR